MSYLLQIVVLNAEGRIEEVFEGNLLDEDLLLLADYLNLHSGGLLVSKNEINSHEKVFKGTELKKLLNKCSPKINTKWYIEVLKRISSINTVRLKIQHASVDSDSTTSLVAV